MKYKFLFLFLITTFLHANAQNSSIEELYDEQRYEELINEYKNNLENLSGEELYYLASAYFMIEDDNNCLRVCDLSLKKLPDHAETYNLKANALAYMQQYNEAIKSYQQAISIDNKNGEYYSGLGDCYYFLRKDKKAMQCFQKASNCLNAPPHAFLMIGQLYSEQKENEKALKTYYLAKSKIDKESESYRNVLFNLAMLEILKEQNEKAEPLLLELISLSPDDYHAYAKLIQAYYGMKKYDEAQQYKTLLYDAWEHYQLPKNMKDMFCFDQFKWENKLIQGFERFESDTTQQIYIKHIFYVVNEDDEVEYKIQTEYSAISLELGGPKYLLCTQSKTMHSTYTIGFNDDFKYDELKAEVIKILEGKSRPSASSYRK